MSVKEARQLLGEEYSILSDEIVQHIIHTFDLIANLVIHKHLKEEK